MPKPEMVKLFHIALECGYANSEGIKDAHERCLHQIIGHFFSMEVVIESASVAVVGDRAFVTLIGSKVFEKERLRQIQQADREYAARHRNELAAIPV